MLLSNYSHPSGPLTVERSDNVIRIAEPVSLGFALTLSLEEALALAEQITRLSAQPAKAAA